MATPTEAEVQTQWKNLTKILDTVRSDLVTDYVAREDTYVQSLEGNFVPEQMDGIRAIRAQLVAAVEGYPAALAPIMREYGRIMGVPDTDLRQLVARRLYDWLLANTATVKSRGISFGSISAGGSNVGTGTINRLTKDENNYNIEATYLDTKTAKVVSDQTTGSQRHQETFELRGAAPARDSIAPSGSGLVTQVRAFCAADSLLSNPSFSDFSGSVSSLTALTGWTAGSSLANFALDQSNYYRDFPGDTTPASLKISANDNVSQKLSVRGASLDPTVPYYIQLAYNRQVGSGDGTLTLALGSQNASVALAAQTGWNILRIAVGQKNWYKTWAQDQPAVTITLGSRTTGYVLVDDVILVPYVPFDNLWYCPVGSATPFMVNDYFTFADALSGSDSVLQYWLWRACNAYVPHDPSPSISDP